MLSLLEIRRLAYRSERDDEARQFLHDVLLLDPRFSGDYEKSIERADQMTSQTGLEHRVRFNMGRLARYQVYGTPPREAYHRSKRQFMSPFFTVHTIAREPWRRFTKQEERLGYGSKSVVLYTVKP